MSEHECPKTGCVKQIDYTMLMCARHWYQVPAPLRKAVWRAWRNGEGAGSAEHLAAVNAAIDAVNR
jgi:hypothetical protein